MRRFYFYILLFATLGLGFKAWTYPSSLANRVASLEAKAEAEAFLQLSEEKQASPEFVSQVIAEAKTLEDQGIASQPYLLKANEGLVKGISPSQINSALIQVEERGIASARLVERAAQQSGEKPGLALRRKANLRFQQTLLNKVSQQTLEELILRSSVKGQPPAALDRVSAAATLIPRFRKIQLDEKEASHRLQEALRRGYSLRDLDEMGRHPEKSLILVEKKEAKPVSPLENQKNNTLKPRFHPSYKRHEPGPSDKIYFKPFPGQKPPHANEGRGRGRR